LSPENIVALNAAALSGCRWQKATDYKDPDELLSDRTKVLT